MGDPDTTQSAARRLPGWAPLLLMALAAVAARGYLAAFGSIERYAYERPIAPWEAAGCWLLLAAVAFAAGRAALRFHPSAAIGAAAIAAVVATGGLWGPGHWVHLWTGGAVAWGLLVGVATASGLAYVAAARFAAAAVLGMLIGLAAPSALLVRSTLAQAWFAVLAIATVALLVVDFLGRLPGQGRFKGFLSSIPCTAGMTLFLVLGARMGFAADASIRLARLPREKVRIAELTPQSPKELMHAVRRRSLPTSYAALAFARGGVLHPGEAYVESRRDARDLLAFPEIESVVIQGSDFTHDDMRPIARLPRLQYLSLQHVDVADDELVFLSELQRPYALWIDSCGFRGGLFDSCAVRSSPI